MSKRRTSLSTASRSKRLALRGWLFRSIAGKGERMKNASERALHTILSLCLKPRREDFDQNPVEQLQHRLDEIRMVAAKMVLHNAKNALKGE